jgi:Flp pilus assembly protein CpaB
MKASTLFAIAIAVFLGLAVVAAAKYSGLFNKKEGPPPPPPPPKLKVLVAAKNLFEGMTIMPGDTRVREMTDEEESHFKENRNKYLAPKAEAATLRVLVRSVEAEQPILREYVEDINLPSALNRRLSSPLMRAVNLSLPLERAGGGLIQKGEHVDVYLTTRISAGKPEHAIIQTAPIARNLKVIVKRNMLFTAMVANDPKKPIDYTLEANPYRAALIEFCKSKGELSLVTTAAPQETSNSPARGVAEPSFRDSTSKEYMDEDDRVESFVRGERSVGEADLERIFNLKAIPYKKPVSIETYSGVHYTGPQVFVHNGNGPMRPATSEPSFGYQFSPPKASTENSGGGNGDNGG